MNLIGTIPTQIEALHSLTYLYLSHNNLTGKLYFTLTKLTHLLINYHVLLMVTNHVLEYVTLKRKDLTYLID